MLFKRNLKRSKFSDQQPSLDHFQIFTCGGAIMYSLQNKVIWSGSLKMWTNMSQQLFAAMNSRSYRGSRVTQSWVWQTRRNMLRMKEMEQENHEGKIWFQYNQISQRKPIGLVWAFHVAMSSCKNVFICVFHVFVSLLKSWWVKYDHSQ